MSTDRRITALCISLLALAPFVVSAWTGPTAAPPANNVAAPINVGTADQVRDGWLGIMNSFNNNALSVIGNLIMSGSNRYLNFGTTWGSSGYGIRDFNGQMQRKDSGGSWVPFSTFSNGLFVSGATSSFNTYGINLTGGCFAVNGVCVGGGGGGSGPWATSGNNIYNSNTGNVGIGTASPGYKLDVNGTLGATGNITVGSATLATNGDLYMPWKGQWLSTVLGNKIDFNTWGPGSTYFGTNGDIYLVWRGQWLSTVLSQIHGVTFGGQFWQPGSGTIVCPWGSVMAGWSSDGYGILCQWLY